MNVLVEDADGPLGALDEHSVFSSFFTSLLKLLSPVGAMLGGGEDFAASGVLFDQLKVLGEVPPVGRLPLRQHEHELGASGVSVEVSQSLGEHAVDKPGFIDRVAVVGFRRPWLIEGVLDFVVAFLQEVVVAVSEQLDVEGTVLLVEGCELRPDKLPVPSVSSQAVRSHRNERCWSHV